MFQERSPHPELIHWHRTATPAPACVPMGGDITADVVIIGAGLTGLRTAVGLAEAGTDVVVLDAHQVGFGASGRSGGQCNPIWRDTPDGLRKRFGTAQGDRLIQTTLTAANDLFDDIRRYGIDCDAEQNGWIQAAHSTKATKSMQALGAAWQAEGAQISEIHGQPEVQAVTGSPDYAFALRHATGGFVQPLSLTRGYARTAQAMGARIFENSPVTKTQRKDGKWHVQTPGGAVVADRVVMTTNAYTDDLWPRLRQTLLPMVSISFATAPLTPAQQQTVLPGRVTISDSRLAIYYSRYDADNRLIFGCVGSNETVGTLGGHSRLATGLRTVFPQIADIGIEATWAGRIGVTPEMMPHLHEPASGVLAGLGFSGRGIAMTSVMGRTLARKILGGANDELAFPVTRITPMPLHWGAKLMQPAMAPVLSLRDKLSVALDRDRKH